MSYNDDGFDWDFADRGSTSALRAATASNPRNLKCPTCGHPDRLTPRDVQLGYHCDKCADAFERGDEIDYFEGADTLTPEDIEAHCRISFSTLFEPAGGVITVQGAGSECIQVIVAFPNNQSRSFTCYVEKDSDKLKFNMDSYYSAVIVDLNGTLA